VLDPAVADAYHFVVASLDHELAGVGGKSVAMTSVGPGDGKTSTALQIANAALEENRKILLIDADVRMRHLSELFGAVETAADGNGQVPPGSSGRPADDSGYLQRLVSTNSGMVLPVAPRPADPLYPDGSYDALDVRHAVRSIGKLFDLVLIDTPAVLVSSNALGVAGQADGVVLVVSHRVSLSHLRDARERLAFVRTPLIGYVYVRPRGLGVRALWGRAQRSGSGADKAGGGPE
jgi:Mrp family chromosome partitioning ATPase